MKKNACSDLFLVELTSRTQQVITLIKLRNHWRCYFFKACIGLQSGFIIYIAGLDKSEDMVLNLILKSLTLGISIALEIFRSRQFRKIEL